MLSQQFPHDPAAASSRHRNLTAPDLPWAVNKEQHAAAVKRCEAMRATGTTCCLPSGVAPCHFEKALGEPGTLKASEYLLLAGPIGKYILEGCFHEEQQHVIFEYLDLLGILWQKSISLDQLQYVESAMPRLLTDLERLLPAYELDMNRHMMLHVVEAIRLYGPGWTYSMFGYERLWLRLKKWMTQTTYPEATMFNAFQTFKAVCLAIPQLAAQVHGDDVDDVHGGKANTPFYHAPHTFDRQTFALKLPSFLQTTEDVPITLYDSQGPQLFGAEMDMPDEHQWQAEFHLFYCNFPNLCRACACLNPATCPCPDYCQLWRDFLAATQQQQPVKRDIPEALGQWHQWAMVQHAAGRLDEHQVSVCSGPVCYARVFDRASINHITFAATRVEGSKKARDSVVLTERDGELWAGRVRAFLSHASPGCDPDPDEEASIAGVCWYAPVSRRHETVLSGLKCPVFKQSSITHYRKEERGQMWPVAKLAPCKLLAVPHKSGSNHLVILSRFSDFLKLVPAE